jgi:type I restriction enzyme S subunit
MEQVIVFFVILVPVVFNAAISLAKERLLALDELVKSRFIEMFGELDLSPQKAEWICLSELGTIYTGTTPSTADNDNWDGDILWITPAEMKEDSFLIDDTVRKITQKGAKSKSLALMPIGTVLLSTRAPIGKVGIVAKPMTCNQGFKNFYCPNTLNSIYLYVLLKNNTQYLNSIGTGTTFKEVSKTTCGNIRIPVPDMAAQNEFAEFVKLIDKSKFVCQFIQGTFYAKFARFRRPP